MGRGLDSLQAGLCFSQSSGGFALQFIRALTICEQVLHELAGVNAAKVSCPIDLAFDFQYFTTRARNDSGGSQAISQRFAISIREQGIDLFQLAPGLSFFRS